VENHQQTNWQVWTLLSSVPVSANPIASQLVKNGAHKTADRKSTRLVNKELSDLWKISTPGIGLHLPGVHTPRRVGSQILVLRLPQFLHAPTQNSKIWRRARIVAISKPEKPLGDPNSYRPIYLLCVPFKILERLIYARVDPIIDPLCRGAGGLSTPVGNEGGKGGHLPRAQHFWGAKLRLECYVLITKRQMSVDANNYNLQNVESHCEISSRSPRFAKRAIINLSGVSRRNFCLQAPDCGCGLTHGCATTLSESQGCELSDFPIIL